AGLMGVAIDRIITVTFLLGGLRGGAAGLLYGYSFGRTSFDLGFLPGIKAFRAAGLGGVGDIGGALLGGPARGLIENISAAWFARLLCLRHVAFWSTGASTTAIFRRPGPLPTPWASPVWGAFPIAMVVCMLAGVILGAPVLRLRGDYLAIVTLGFGEIVRIIAQNTTSLGAARGITGIPHPTSIGNIHFKFDALPYYYLPLAAIVLAIVV